ncbi:MAG: CAP domain-containing protein [Thermoanaerobaculia bacterium]
MRKVLLLVIVLIGTAAFAAEITPASVVAEMNLRRALFGLPPLHADVRLEDAAGDRISDMEDQGYWAHISPDGKEPFRWLHPHGYDFHYAGENLASGFETAEVLVDAWMESKGHRQNILSPLYHDCGVAVIEGSTTGRASGKSVVVLFGCDLSAGAVVTAATSPAP